jgi:membrane protein
MKILARIWNPFWKKINKDQIIDRASGLAFQILSSFIPLLALSYYFFAVFHGFAFLETAIQKYVFQYLAPGTGRQLLNYVGSLQNRVSPKEVGVFGLLGFLYSAFAMIYKAENSLNLIWGVPNSRPWLQRLGRYFVILLLAPFILSASLAMTSYLLTQVTASSFLLFILVALPYFFSSLLFSLVYKILPHVRVRPQAALKAGFITGLSFEILKQAVAYYAKYALQNSIYGSLATIPILFVWIYVIAILFMLGGELCSMFGKTLL